MLNGEPIGYAQSYVALGSGDGWWGRRNRSRSTRNRPVTGECITTEAAGTKLVQETLVELLFNDPEVTKDPNGPVAEATCERSVLRESGVLRGKVP